MIHSRHCFKPRIASSRIMLSLNPIIVLVQSIRFKSHHSTQWQRISPSEEEKMYWFKASWHWWSEFIDWHEFSLKKPHTKLRLTIIQIDIELHQTRIQPVLRAYLPDCIINMDKRQLEILPLSSHDCDKVGEWNSQLLVRRQSYDMLNCNHHDWRHGWNISTVGSLSQEDSEM
jgi:hypothetical protein